MSKRALNNLPAETRKGSYRKQRNYLLTQRTYRGGTAKLFGFGITVFFGQSLNGFEELIVCRS